MPLKHLLHMAVVSVDDSHSALPKEHSLTLQILVKILVLIGTDMIRLQIGKHTEIEDKASRSVLHQCLGRNLHHNSLQSG